MAELNCDVAIIGAGTAGLAAERSARRAGARTLLVDDGYNGTTCATVGCMPSKLLIAAAHAAHAVRQAGLFGIEVPEPVIDGRAVMARVREMRDKFVDGTLESIANLPEGVAVAGRARFASSTELTLADGRRITAKAIVVATGARPKIPEVFAALGDRALTNETIFDLPDLPASIAVIGAGPLGLELAQALARLGVVTLVFDEGDKFAGLDDPEVASELIAILEKEMPIHLGVKIEADLTDEGVELSWSGKTSGKRHFAYVLVATGRPPQLADLELAATGLELDDHGTPLCDPATLQCGDSAIFMAGDADARRPVLHEASSEGAIAGRNAASFPTVHPTERAVAFSIMFTDPPLAVIGAGRTDDHVIGNASYADQGRAKVDARNVGCARIYADKSDGRLVGAIIAAPGGDHMGHLLAWAIGRGETATTLLDLPFYHPTVEEGLKPALLEICKIVHAPMSPDRDDGIPPGA
jgi:dihydrolipoamide dehydrogenase